MVNCPKNYIKSDDNWQCTEAPETDALPLGIIIGCSIGGVVILVAAIILIVCCVRKKRRRPPQPAPALPGKEELDVVRVNLSYHHLI